MINKYVRRIVALLHSQGREVTPAEVESWLVETSGRFGRSSGATPIVVAIALLQGDNKTLTGMLHLRFGDAL